MKDFLRLKDNHFIDQLVIINPRKLKIKTPAIVKNVRLY